MGASAIIASWKPIFEKTAWQIEKAFVLGHSRRASGVPW
jgi:2-oxo-4-hydroxy-4-carboxy--5-ureidoimidazoline (OHCU) decarboxylase